MALDLGFSEDVRQGRLVPATVRAELQNLTVWSRLFGTSDPPVAKNV